MKINFPLNYQLRLYFSRLEKREGVASKIYKEEDKHILLWDFDNIELPIVIKSLRVLQKLYKLPTIYIVSSSVSNYHAYSFAARTFREVIHIISGTPEIDTMYLRLGLVRGYYTLRVSERKGEIFQLVKILNSVVPDEVNPLDVCVSDYMTINKGVKNA